MTAKQNFAIGVIGIISVFALFHPLQDRSAVSTPIPFKAYPDSGKAAIYLWPPSTSAAIVDDEGNRCVLVASGAQSATASMKSSLHLPDLIEALKGLDVSSQKQLIENFTRISQADSRAAALDVALFHLCLLDQNGTFGAKSKKPSGKGSSLHPLAAPIREPTNEENSTRELKMKAIPILEAYKFSVEKAFSMKIPGEKEVTAVSTKKAGLN
jgi:hypothetical protein